MLLAAYDRIVSTNPVGHSVSVDSRPVALVGTWRKVAAQAAAVEAAINARGGWSSPWSFVVKKEAQARLKKPFYLYAYAGRGELPFRFRVDDYVTGGGAGGMSSPWPELTDAAFRDAARSGPRQSEAWRTWFRIGAVERISPSAHLRDFEVVPKLSTPNNVLNQNAFGYVSVRRVCLATLPRPRLKPRWSISTPQRIHTI